MSILPQPEPLQALISALRKLPGIGVRNAQRMAYHLLQYEPQTALVLSEALRNAVDNLKHCERCNTFTPDAICATCANPKRDATQLCIVETPPDQNVIENSHGYKGLYYVLMGSLRPIDGVGPQELGFDRLIKRVSDGVVEEVILANNFTAEGETTAHYLGDILKKRGFKVSRIARGIPVGSELEYVDAGTVAWAFMERKDI